MVRQGKPAHRQSQGCSAGVAIQKEVAFRGLTAVRRAGAEPDLDRPVSAGAFFPLQVKRPARVLGKLLADVIGRQIEHQPLYVAAKDPDDRFVRFDRKGF